MQPSLVLASAIPLAAWRSVEGKTLNKLLSVPVEDRTPNIVFARGEKSFSGAAPSILRFPIGRPASQPGRSHQLAEHKPRHRVPSGRFQLGTFRQRAFFHIAPQRNQQFSSQRYNANSSHPAAAFGKALAIPAAQLAVGLVAQPGPGDLNSQRSYRTITGLANTALACGASVPTSRLLSPLA
jgi:hypothetical protein